MVQNQFQGDLQFREHEEVMWGHMRRVRWMFQLWALFSWLEMALTRVPQEGAMPLRSELHLFGLVQIFKLSCSVDFWGSEFMLDNYFGNRKADQHGFDLRFSQFFFKSWRLLAF